MDNPIFSVIVPVYNTAEYLSECVWSVRNQDCSDWEMVLIDDGSTDGSRRICERFQDTDDRIRLIACEENHGVSHARNLGIEASVGRYLFCLDSDDLICPRLLSEVKQRIEDQTADVFVVRRALHPEKISSQQFMGMQRVFDWRTVPADQVMHWWQNGIFLKGVKFFSREVIGDLRYDESLKYGEDTLFEYEALTHVKTRLCYADTQAYYYRRREGQAVADVSAEHLNQTLYVYGKLRDEESRAGRNDYADFLERQRIGLMRYFYLKNKDVNPEYAAAVRDLAEKEKESPIFQTLSRSYRVILYALIADTGKVISEQE